MNETYELYTNEFKAGPKLTHIYDVPFLIS